MKPIQQKLLRHLFYKQEWVEAKELAKLFSVTTRTISSYVKEINIQYKQTMILSSYKGYRFNEEIKDWQDDGNWKDQQELHNRTSKIIMKLITHTNTNLYDLADALYISDSLLNLELKKVAAKLTTFHLILQRENNMLNVEGTEKNKRKLMASLLREESNTNLTDLLRGDRFQSEYLSSKAISNQLLPQLNAALRSEEQLLLNDFGIQNILIHTLVLTDRILAHRVLPEKMNPDIAMQTPEYTLAKKLQAILEEQLSIQVPDIELNYLTLVISSNALMINPEIVNEANIHEYIPEKYVNLGKALLKSLEKNYFLHPFDEDFTLKFTLHIMNLVIRSRQGITFKNTYVQKTKEDYPLIYDMALFVVKQLSKKCHIQINEDEVTFLVYHIGSYLLMKQNRHKINVCVVYLDYNNFHLDVFTVLKQRYDTSVNFTITPLSAYQEAQQKQTAFLITLGDFQLQTSKKILRFGLIPTADDFLLLDETLRHITRNIQKQKLKNSLSHFIRRELFDFDIYAENERKLMDIMIDRCIALKLCDKRFRKAVMEREQLSSTCIVNGIAVPHALEHVCQTSFFYIVINTRDTPWGKQMVRIIIMIGTSMEDYDSFGEVFDNLIKVLYDSASLPKLLECKSYDAFINTLAELMLNHT